MNPPATWIGTDESGKGDYFGPLVIAGVCLDRKIGTELSALGIKDSKRLSDSRILLLAEQVRKLALASDVVVILPERYNELYLKMKNLNRLLAWGHARVIENILERKECSFALTDQFGDRTLVEKALMTHGRKITLEQRPKAEEDIAVASASVIARGEFLKGIEKLSKREGISLPKGASEAVVRAGKTLFSQKGLEGLKRTAKMHFKTTQAVLGE
jgi:ribonuclease HIII